jgi:hypothetical protein
MIRRGGDDTKRGWSAGAQHFEVCVSCIECVSVAERSGAEEQAGGLCVCVCVCLCVSVAERCLCVSVTTNHKGCRS